MSTLLIALHCYLIFVSPIARYAQPETWKSPQLFKLIQLFLDGGGVNSFIRHNRILAFEVEGSHSINSCVIRDRVTSIIILKYENNQLTIVSNGNNNFVIRKNYIFYLDKINNV